MHQDQKQSPIARRTFLKGGAAALGAAGLAVLWPGGPAAQAAAVPAALRRRAGELTIGIDSDPVTLDTRITSVTQGYSIIHHITEPLVFREADGTIIPWLAQSWERQNDTTVRLSLRQNVKFTNGEPMDAEAVKYSIDSVISPDVFPKTSAQRRSFLKAIDRVDIVDANTVTITTKYPSRSLLSYLTTFGVLPPRAAQDAGERFGLAPVGTGPYKLMEYTPGSRLTLEANGDYWGGAPASDRWTIRIIPEAATRVAALEAGEVGMINNLSPDQVSRIQANPSLDTAEVMSTRILHLHMMTNRSPFQDPKVRQAVNHGVDKEGIVRALLGGHGLPATKLVYSPAIPYATDQSPYEYDLNKAKQLLSDAGAVGAKIKFAHTTGRFLNDVQIGQTLGQQLQRLGFDVTVETSEWGVLFQKILDGTYDIWYAAYGTLTLDPEYALSWLYGTPTSWNKYSNPRVDELMLKGDQNFADAADTYRELQSIIWQDSPNAWLYFQPELHGISKKLKNHRPRPDEYWIFKDVYMEG